MARTMRRVWSATTGGVVCATVGVLVMACMGATSESSDRASDVVQKTVAPQATVKAFKTGSPPLRVFTHNIAFTLSDQATRQDIRRDLQTLKSGVAGFQEFSGPSHRQILETVAKNNGWEVYIPGTGGRSIPIAWRTNRFSFESAESIFVHKSTGKTFPSRWINVVRLRENHSGRILGVINTHAIARASHDARPHDRHGDASRIGYLRLHLAKLRETILALQQETPWVVAMGDLNVNFLADQRRQVAGLPTEALGPYVSFNMPNEGSRGLKSLLDYQMTPLPELGSALTPLNSNVVRGSNSDHEPVVATYQMEYSMETDVVPGT